MEGRLEGLDALRGIAALLVVSQHVLAQVGSAGSPLALAIIASFDVGKFGVGLFFITSGFVIPSSLKDRPGWLLKFGIGRAARLLPALWLSIAMLVLLGFARGQLLSPGMIAANMMMVARPLGFELLSLPYWTLEWELGFYVVTAVLFSFRRLSDPRYLAAAAIVALLIGTCLAKETVFLAFMFGGALLRIVVERGPGKAWLIAVIAAFAVHTGIVATSSNWAYYLGAWAAIPVFWMFLRLQCPPPILVTIGALSYSIYLFHPLMLSIAKAVVTPAAPVGYAAFVFGASIVTAANVYRWVELPGIRFGKALAKQALPGALGRTSDPHLQATDAVS